MRRNGLSGPVQRFLQFVLAYQVILASHQGLVGRFHAFEVQAQRDARQADQIA